MTDSGLQRLNDNKSYVVNNVDPHHLLPYLPFFDIYTNRDLRLGTVKELNKVFYKYILENPPKNVFRCFLDALKAAGMDKVYKMLNKEAVTDERVFTDLVLRNRDSMEMINWSSVLNYYYEQELITFNLKKDLENLSCEYKWTSIICYFSTMDGWFFDFVKCLKCLKELKAMDALSKLFLISNSDESLKKAIEEVKNNTEATTKELKSVLESSCQENNRFCNYIKLFGVLIYGVDILPISRWLYQNKIISFDEKKIITEDKRPFFQLLCLLSFLEKENSKYLIMALIACKEIKALAILDFDINDDEITIEKKIAKINANINDYENNSKVETYGNSIGHSSELQIDAAKVTKTKNVNEEISYLSHPLQSCSSYPSNKSMNIIFNFMDDDQLADLQRDKTITEKRTQISNKLKIKGLKNEREIPDSYMHNIHLKMDSIKENSDGKKNTTIESDMTNYDFLADYEAELVKELLEGEKLDYGSNLEFELRDYQRELAKQAIAGQNCIIVAPTGSGKTHVAIHIIKEHLKNAGKKVLFIVPTVALVEQQKKQILQYSEAKTYGMSGVMDLSLDNLIDKYDVFVLTPQILLNQLQHDDTFLMKLTLVIFDECHHTNKDHPYNSIMTNYIKIRHEDKNAPLPQIVGLTASIGVGKSKTNADAVNYVKLICANLDCPIICTVVKHLKELQHHVNKPEEERKEINGRSQDPFLDKVNQIMASIEKRMMETPEKINAENEIKNFAKDFLVPPSERGSDPYTQWLSRIKKSVCTIHKQDTRMCYITLIEYLMMYNDSLMINADCRTKDALNYVQNKVVDGNLSSLPLPDGLNEQLVDQWREIYERLKAIASDPKYNNPKLDWIKHRISNYYKDKSDSRCILFCKTRDTATALVNWMKETPELESLNPTKLVGTNAPANSEGMTSAQQDDVLKYFKNGDHKIIIATSVAEEGLDVQKCNLVIRYEHVTNSIARVQTRGRARQDNAQYILVAEKGRGVAEKEEKNAIREEMMKKAIEKFQSFGFQERKNSMHSLQKEALISKSMTEYGKFASMDMKLNHLSDEEFQLRCLKCDQFVAFSSDIRKIEESHHIVKDQLFKTRIEIRPHPRKSSKSNFSLNFEKTGKIYCIKCHSEWGIMALYKKVPFPVIKISGFIVKSGKHQENYKKWKQVPFKVKTLAMADLEEASRSRDDWNEINISDECSSSD